MMKISIFKFLISGLILLSLSANASTYVSLTPVLTEIIYALNAQDNLLGVSNVCNYPLEVKEKEIIGDTYFVNMEKIINLKPDYLFAMASNKPMLGQLALTKTKAIHFEFSSIKEIYSGIETIAKLTNKEENAKKLIKDIDKKINQYKTKNPKKILYVVQTSPLITIGNKSYINDIIEKSGHINTTSNINFYYPNITLEYALEKNPDIILICYNDDISKLKKLFPKAKFIFLTPEEQDIINRPGPRVYEAVKFFSEL